MIRFIIETVSTKNGKEYISRVTSTKTHKSIVFKTENQRDAFDWLLRFGQYEICQKDSFASGNIHSVYFHVPKAILKEFKSEITHTEHVLTWHSFIELEK